MMYGTIDQVKKRSGITADDVGVDSADFDTFVEDLLAKASEYIERYCGRTFGSKTVTEKCDGKGNDTLMLNNFPVISVASVTIDDRTLAGDKYRIRPTSSYQDENGGILERVDGGIFRDSRQNVEVEYTWGYQTIPEPVVDVAEEIASEMLKTAANNYKTGGLESMNIEGFQTKFEDKRPLTESQKARLKQFKKAVFA